MTILVLGSAGNLGTALTEYGAEREDLRLIGWDKTDIDVSDQVLLSKKIIELKPEIIINTVAFNDVDSCETSEESKSVATLLNVELVKTLADISIEIGATLVHYSSDYVFKGDSDAGYAEEDTPNPLSVYGQTKLEGEKEIISASGKGLQWYLIRTSKLFGPKGTSVGAKPSFFELMFRLSATNPSLKLVNDEIGSFTYSRDLAAATIALLDDNVPFGIYHLINGGETSWYEAAKYFFESLGKQVSLEPVPAESFPRPAKRPKHSLLLNTKRPALRSWQEAVSDYCKKETFI